MSGEPGSPLLGRSVSLLPPALTDVAQRWPFAGLCVRAGTLLALFYAVDQFMLVGMRLTAEAYAQDSLALGIVQRLGVAGCVVLFACLAFLWRFGLVSSRWQALEHGMTLRALVVFLSVVVAWPLTTYAYNYYFDQGYYGDRLVIVMLLPLIWWRPVFVYPFLMLVFATLWQLGVPPLNNGSHFAHKLQVLHVLTLFGAHFLLFSATGSRRGNAFFFLAGCLVAAGYWQPAMTKLQLNWITHGQLYHMPLAAYAHGWLSFMPSQFVVDAAGVLARFDWPMRIFVLAAEMGTLVLFWRRWYAMGLLACLMVFHVGVFVLYGFLFWTWFLLDGAVVLILWKDRHRQQIDIFTTGHLLLAVPLIYLAPYWASPPTLGWYDTRLSYTFRYEVTDARGVIYTLPPRFFAPYDDVFTMANFSYLVDRHGVLVASYGITGDRARAEALMTATTPAQVYALEKELGASRYRAERAATFYAFLERFLANRNRGDREPGFLRYLRSPPQFWSFSRGAAYTGEAPIREIVVKEVTTLFDDRELREIRDLELARIRIGE